MAAFTHETSSSASKLSPNNNNNTENQEGKEWKSTQRPTFSSSRTSDRLRESEIGVVAAARVHDRVESGRGIKQQPRKSVFREVGLVDNNNDYDYDYDSARDREVELLSRGLVEGEEEPLNDTEVRSSSKNRLRKNPSRKKSSSWLGLGLGGTERPVIKISGVSAPSPPMRFSSLPRVALLVFLIAVVVPALRFKGADVPIAGVGARVANVREELVRRQQYDPTNICTRWSHQSAVVNGTMYIYGGRAKTTAQQTDDTWNDDFLTLDLTRTWQIGSPAFSALPEPSGPPAVANGYLWSSYTSLFLYGGEFSDTPPNPPTAYSTWEYSVDSKSWIQHSSPTTTAGNNSDTAGMSVQRSAEGAGLSVPELGLSWYFGGHLDLWTTEGWSNQIARVYLRSLLEFTHPGFMNSGVQGLGAGQAGAPAGGAYRNITQGGIQEQAGFTERADGVLVYVPGWGEQGIILGLAGGTNTTFTEMNVIDIYDVATSTWYKQPTVGTSPGIRVNPCAVVFAAPDFSSFNIYLYGGQNLQPAGAQTQYDDLWILTIPSFTWVQADLSGQSNPPARAGHTCHAWDGQMVVVGGYVGTEISCDSPGVYVFNASSLQWTTGFTSLTTNNSSSPASSDGSDTPLSGSGTGSDGQYHYRNPLTGSYGYGVPAAIQKVIGGDDAGGATATTPAAGPASAGPIATGHPPVFTITKVGSTTTMTAGGGATNTGSATSSGSDNSGGGSTTSNGSSKNVAAIAAGAIAGILAVVAAYLAFCTWLYRRQVGVYRNHVAMSQRAALGWTVSPADERGGNNGVNGGNFRYSDKLAPPHGAVIGAFGTDISGAGTNTSGSATEGSAAGGSLRNEGDGSGRESLGSVNQVVAGGGRGDGGGGAGISGGAGATLSPMHSNTAYMGHGGGDEAEEEGHGMSMTGVGLHHVRNPSSGTAGGRGNGNGNGSITTNSSTEDLLGGQEPSFFSVVLSPRRTLRVINRD